MSLNIKIVLVCPMCGREHPRCIKNGLIYEDGYVDASYVDKIKPVKAAYHKEPKTIRMKTHQYSMRHGVTVESPRDLINESWYERYANKVKQE